MKTEQQYFEEGRPIQTYMNEMGMLKEESFAVYEQFHLPADGFAEELKQDKLHFLTITEDWCGDAMMINPVIRKLAEAADIEMRVALRDADTDLIDRHLTNGGRAIPMILIFNNQGDLLGKWGPRAPKAQQIVDEVRAALPPKEDPSFAEKQKMAFGSLRKRYTEEPALWSDVYDDFKKTILAILK
ncbi:thioredoxin family protein [Mesobacillus subterraneus]|uniref:thioredoxin family protein n=1 Tax=Mesobacillus subterraneus TaxID=285983 RepID=UPI00203D10DC|nr:thioredoxin family protein [Mesobacillus subterraneus]MCM3666997.1 thioredoxin family protein [Mesobacillus subterraneus]MCM3685828.1 thioredoxin family protein [Mesobacillus subterraneus]